MYRHTSKIIAVLAAYCSLAVAQHQHAPVPVVPTQSMTTAPTGSPPRSVAVAAPVSSAITTYRRFDPAEPLADWRQANKTVEEIGGWRAYAKEAAKEATKEAVSANSTVAPAGATK